MEETFPRRVIVASAFLGFRSCRYSGQKMTHPFVERLREFVEFRPVCPKMEVGLGVPRDPLRIVVRGVEKLLVQPATGRDVSAQMRRFSGGFVGAILDASLRAGSIPRDQLDTFLNLRYIGGGAEGTQTDYVGPGGLPPRRVARPGPPGPPHRRGLGRRPVALPRARSAK